MKQTNPFKRSAFIEAGLKDRRFISDDGMVTFELAKQKVDLLLGLADLHQLKEIVQVQDVVHDILVFQIGNYLLFEKELKSPRIAQTKDETKSKKFRLEAIDSARELVEALERLESFGVELESLSKLINEIRTKSERYHVISTYLRSRDGFIKYFFGNCYRMDASQMSRGLGDAHKALFIAYTNYILNDVLELKVTQEEIGTFCRAVVDEPVDKESARQWFKNCLDRYGFQPNRSDPTWYYWRTLMTHRSFDRDPLAERFRSRLVNLLSGREEVSEIPINELVPHERYVAFKSELKALANLK